MAKLTEMENIISANQMLISGIIDDYASDYRAKNLEISLNRQLTKKQYELIEENIKLDWNKIKTDFNIKYKYYLKLLDTY